MKAVEREFGAILDIANSL